MQSKLAPSNSIQFTKVSTQGQALVQKLKLSKQDGRSSGRTERGRPEGFFFLCSGIRQQSEEAAGKLERLTPRDSSNCVSEQKTFDCTTEPWFSHNIKDNLIQTTGQALV